MISWSDTTFVLADAVILAFYIHEVQLIVYSNVAAVLERKVTSKGVPNLQTLDFWAAASMAAEFGMKVVPVGEVDSYPQIEPGHIVSQDPKPGTLMEINPNSQPQIQVVLSKRV